MLKLLIELGPLIVFFATFKLSNIITATALMLVVTLAGLIVSYIIDRKISFPLLISGSILFISGMITIVSGDAKYIKIKPTIVFIIFGSVLLIGAIRGKSYIKQVFAHAIQMEDKAWLILSKRFAIYFFVMAIINEIVWRNYSDNVWVEYKLFGFLPLSVLFISLQARFIYRNSKINIGKNFNNSTKK